MQGAVFAIAAAIFFSLSHVTVRRGVSSLGVATGTAVMLIAGTLTVGIGAALAEDWHRVLAFPLTSLLYFAAAGIVHFVAGWGFMNVSAREIGASRMSATVSVTPIFAAALAVLFLNESLNSLVTIGILLVVAGVYAITRS